MSPWGLCSPADVGWKALMGALSDLAAMGARPIGALVALCVPDEGGTAALALGVMEGVAEASRQSGCPVVGGDVSAAATLMVAVTVMGTVDGGRPVTRDGAKPGDAVLVTGVCGGSAAGLRVLRSPGANDEPAELARAVGLVQSLDLDLDLDLDLALAGAYRRPHARLAEGVVARLAGAHAMIDVSDGLALDLHRLADASGVGFVLDAVPVAEGATTEEALGGGEDYELIVVMGAESVEEYLAKSAEAGLRPPVVMGTITDRLGERTLHGRALAQLGWQHKLG
jgi:thiamine-monophosphate kinase